MDQTNENAVVAATRAEVESGTLNIPPDLKGIRLYHYLRTVNAPIPFPDGGDMQALMRLDRQTVITSAEKCGLQVTQNKGPEVNWSALAVESRLPRTTETSL